MCFFGAAGAVTGAVSYFDWSSAADAGGLSFGPRSALAPPCPMGKGSSSPSFLEWLRRRISGSVQDLVTSYW